MGDSRGLDSDGMNARTKVYERFSIDEIFSKGFFKADEKLLDMMDSLERCNSFVPELGTIANPYTTQWNEISLLKLDTIFLGGYPKILISRMRDDVDANFAVAVSEAYEQLKSIQMEDIVYSNATADSIVKSPQETWKEIRVEVEKAESDIKNANESALIAMWKVSGNESLRAKCEAELKERFRNQNYVDTSGRMAEIFPLLKEQDAIDAFEKKHPIYANRMDDFLDTDPDGMITEEDRIRIKYMVYVEADEDYRDYFLKNVKNFEFITTIHEGDSASNFSSTKGGVSLNYYKDFYSNKKGPYTTLMHELGHDADYYCDDHAKKNASDTRAYKKTEDWVYIDDFGRTITKTEEKTLREIIQYDVFDNPNNLHSVYSVASDLMNGNSYGNASLGDVINVLKGEKEYSELDGDSQLLYDDAVKKNKCRFANGNK